MFDLNWSPRVDEKRIEKTEEITRQTRPVAIRYASVKPKKDGTTLIHSTNTPPTITRQYAFMVIPHINIKRLTRMLCYSSYKMQTRIKLNQMEKMKKKKKKKKNEVNKKTRFEPGMS